LAQGYGAGMATGLAVGIAAAFLRPLWLPAMTRWGRPAAKAAIKQGVLAYELGRERVAELGESVSDLLAEAQVELAAERATQSFSEVSADAGR
jgi:hypothetical protein